MRNPEIKLPPDGADRETQQDGGLTAVGDTGAARIFDLSLWFRLEYTQRAEFLILVGLKSQQVSVLDMCMCAGMGHHG